MPPDDLRATRVPDRDVQGRFASRTWHHSDFDPDDLVARRKDAGLTVSVVVPARNEVATVGQVVATLRHDLVDRLLLVDEVLVVDGGSTDGTARAAAAAGARVVHQDEVLPEAGPGRGKGEALWKGLYASSGDLVVFVDADIHDLDQRFVVGLLGPLLHDEEVAFVKASYDRPFLAGGDLEPEGGGRVTELLARPLLAAFWPELAWLAQPLSGEYAGRRSLLERVPFVQGYGVELGLLVDIAHGWSADVIAQVDLDRRIHEHQPLDALGRMAAEILAVAVRRLEEQGRARFDPPPGSLLAQPVRDPAGALDLATSTVHTAQRPPLATWLAAR